MNRFFAGMFLITCALPAALSAQDRDSYEITSRFIGLAEGAKVKMALAEQTATGIKFREDSCYVTHGQFHLTGHITQGPQYFTWKRT